MPKTNMTLLLVALSSAAVFVAACGNDSQVRFEESSSSDNPVGTGGSSSQGGGAQSNSGGGGGLSFVTSGGGSIQGFSIEPSAAQVIQVKAGDKMPTLVFSSFLNGSPAKAGWGVDRGEIGIVEQGPVETSTFTPSGRVGGLVTIAAKLNKELLERKVMVQLSASQNGPGSSPEEQSQVATQQSDLLTGGGIGGVGGEGLGVAVNDPNTLAALNNPTANGQAEGLELVYPYDKTVWPRGMLAPLLMWRWSLGDADALKIELQTSSESFRYEGTFGKPAILTNNGKPMVRHPIPQDAWRMATNSAGGTTLDSTPETLTIKLTIARNGVGYGPITQTWRIAPARLAGTIYYNSYGTQLAKNYAGAVGGDGLFGGAVLSIKVGDSEPQLVAGASGPATGCRVCHSVAADGSRLIAQRGNNTTASSSYSITNNGVNEELLNTSAIYPAISPDGAFALNAAGQLLDLNQSGTPVPVNGLSGVSSNLGTPSFAPAGDKIVFNPMAGPGVTNPQQKLVVMDYNATTKTFSSPVEVVDNSGQTAETRPGWPAFSPDGKSVVYQQQVAAGVDGNSHGDLRTRKGAKAYLAWAPSNGSAPAITLAQANGTGHAPQLQSPLALSCTGDGAQVGGIDADHSDDTNLNYEPTMNPVASGGYFWVVFTSRRLYGNVAEIPPFCSDPRGVNLIDNITPKKLWVAAVDVNAPPGSDPSHPAFYLPAQELLAGNARAFWVLEPCRKDGEGCETGDQCCNGFCSSTGMGDDPLICTPGPDGKCSKPQEKCVTGADCCDATNICINGFCTPPSPN